MNQTIEPQGGGQAPLQRMVGFLGLRRSMMALLSMAILVGLGEKMAERFLPVYLVALGVDLRYTVESPRTENSEGTLGL